MMKYRLRVGQNDHSQKLKISAVNVLYMYLECTIHVFDKKKIPKDRMDFILRISTYIDLANY